MYSLKSYKKVMCAAAALCITFGAATAQPSGADEGFYVQLGGGYSFGAGKGYPAQNYSYTSESETRSSASFSLGKGVNTVLGFGCMLNKNVGVELNAGYLIGGSNTTESSSNTTYGNSSATNTYKLSSLELTPALRLVAPIGDSYSLYSRVGVIVPIFGTAVNEYNRTQEQSNATTSEYEKEEFTSYFKLGYAAALGVSANLGERVSVFAEVNAAVRSFELKKGTITESTSTDASGKVTNELEGMTTRDKETEFLRELTTNSSDPTDNDAPRKSVSYSMPASSVGVTVGVIFKF